MELAGRVGLVTGGGTGIGRAVGLALAQAGMSAVMVNYSRSREDAERTVGELRALGCAADCHQADVASEAEVRAMVAGVVRRWGRLDVLVNNAGTTEYTDDLDGVTDAIWDRIFAVNLKGSFYCARAASRHLKETRGAIVNIASMGGHRGGGASLPYGLSKAGVLQLTRGLAVSLAPAVRVNSVSPGPVETRWWRVFKSEEFTRDAKERAAASTPLGRIATPEDVAKAVLGLLICDFVTGQDLPVDGGRGIRLN